MRTNEYRSVRNAAVDEGVAPAPAFHVLLDSGPVTHFRAIG